MTNSKRVVQWQQRAKKRSVVYKGGRCVLCGYAKSMRSLNFHHLDPMKKDFAISGGVMAWDKMKLELDKCVLLCANCHGEVHDGSLEVTSFGPTPEEGMMLVHEAGLDTYSPQPRHQKCCPLCDAPIGWASNGCQSCMARKQKTKIIWPDPIILADMVHASSFRQVAKQLGVSDRVVAKHMRNHPV